MPDGQCIGNLPTAVSASWLMRCASGSKAGELANLRLREPGDHRARAPVPMNVSSGKREARVTSRMNLKDALTCGKDRPSHNNRP